MIIFLHPYQIANSYSSTFRRLRRLCIKQQKKSFQNQPSTKNRVKFFLWLWLSRSEWNLGQMHFLQFFSFLFCIFWVCYCCYFRSRGAHKKIKKKKKRRRKLHCRHSEERKVNEPRLIQFEWGTIFFLQNALGVHITLHLFNQMSIYMSYAVASRLILTYQDSPPSS